MKIVIIGAGNVGTNLHHAFALKGIKAQLVKARTLLDDQMANDQMVNDADVYIYTVADKVLVKVINKVNAPKALHIHTSGSVPMLVFGEDKPHAGILYFFQSFSKEALIDDWSSIPCFFEGKNIDDVAAIYSLAQTLTNRIYETTQHDRERLHIAGIFANNYTNLMYRLAKDMLNDTSIPFEVLLPLIDQTAAKVHKISPDDAQTGPAVRGDFPVLLNHTRILYEKKDGILDTPNMLYLYMSLAQCIFDANKKKSDDSESFFDQMMKGIESLGGKMRSAPIPARRHRKSRE